MTVGELRKALEDMPDDMEVFYETDVGLCTVDHVSVEKVKRYTEEDGRLADVFESADGFAAVTIG